MKEPAWVLPEVVMAVHQMLLAEHGGATGVRDRALLDSALSRPQQRFAYANEISIFDLAASYCYGLVKNHPFVDGNKRIALTISAMFLEINGYSLNTPEADAVVSIESVAAGELTEAELAVWFKGCSSPYA